MIAAIALAVLVAQASPAPGSPMRQNQAPVKQQPAPLAISAIPGIDRTFALAAIQGNNAEIDMAQLALRRSGIPEIKNFAEKMLSEHMGLAGEMMPALMRVSGAPPPQRLSAPDTLAVAHLQSASDVDFDQGYALQQVGDHLATLTAFETEADNGTDPQLKMLARKWLPTIQAHLESAISLTKHIGGASPLRSQ